MILTLGENRELMLQCLYSRVQACRLMIDAAMCPVLFLRRDELMKCTDVPLYGPRLLVRNFDTCATW